MAILGPLISAGASLLGGLFSGNQSEKNAQLQMQNAAQDRALQKEFAQNSIQWKTADAKSAGISPYYALGAPTASYTPVSIGDGAESGIGKGLSAASQDLGRAAAAAMSKPDRDEVAKKSADLALENSSLQNELLKTQIAKMRGQIGPAMPTLQKGAHLIDGQPATEIQTVSGAPVKSDDVKQQAETIPKHSRIRPLGIKLHTNPYFSDAEDIETRYGDVAEEIGGMANFAGDLYHTGKAYWRRYAPYYIGKAKRALSRRNSFERRFGHYFEGR